MNWRTRVSSARSSFALKASDDPEDLLEQADLVKDNEDKVRKELKTVEKRIAEAKEERALDTRVRQFMGEDALFDEQDRRLRVHRESVEAAGTRRASPPAAPTTKSAFTDSAAAPGTGTQGVGAFESVRLLPPPVAHPRFGRSTAPTHAPPWAAPASPATATMMTSRTSRFSAPS